MARSVRYLASIAALALAAISFAPAALAQASTKISITTGGTGGVYYPLGGGMANVLSKMRSDSYPCSTTCEGPTAT